MSEIKSFSDYTSKYNSNVDYSALFGGTSDSSSVGNTNMLSDYAAIKNGSYGKLMKAYYAKQDAEKLSGKGDTSQKLTLMKTSADSLKKSADALNDASLWEKKKIKKKDEKTGEETEVEDYDWDAITKKVKSFIDDYNDVVKEAGESNTKDVLRNASWMTGMTDKTSHLLSKIGITIGKGNKLELDNDETKNAIQEILNRYDIIFDCSTDDGMMYVLDKLNLRSKLINISISNHANELVCAMGNNITETVKFIFTQIIKSDTLDMFYPTGCWSPTFKASYNDIAAKLQLALKHIIGMLTAIEPESSFYVSETQNGMSINRL